MSASSHPPARERAEKEAALWAARLETGPLSPLQQVQLSDWLEANPDHRWLLSRYRELNALLAEQVPVLMDATEVEAVVDRAAGWQRFRRRLLPVMTVAALVVLGLTVWTFQPDRMATSSGERRTVSLEDGSRVELNAETRLEVKFRRGERRVALFQGEALFQVVHDPLRPFVVSSDAGAVRVTGTAFNVREKAAGALVVTVLEGSVQVQPDQGVPIPVSFNQQAEVAAGQVQVRALTLDQAQNAVAWRVGQVAFNDVRLDDALRSFAPYHSKKVEVDASVAALRVGGRFSLDDLDGFLAAIEEALPVTVLRGSETTLRVLSRKQSAVGQ